MDLQIKELEQCLVVSITGSMDAFTSDEAESLLATQIGSGRGQIVVDLSGVDFMSSAGIRVIVEALKLSRKAGGDLRLAAPATGVHRTLEISGLLRVIEVYPSIEEAVASFQAPMNSPEND